MKFGLSEDHLERLEDGQTVRFTIPDLIQPGRNATIEIEPADLDNRGKYDNVLDIPRREE